MIESLVYFGFFLLLIFIDSGGDASKGRFKWFSQDLLILSIFAMPTLHYYFFIPIWKLMIAYVLLRLALFNLVFNKVAGNAWWYLNDNKKTDWVLVKVRNKFSIHALMWIYIMAFLFSLVFLGFCEHLDKILKGG